MEQDKKTMLRHHILAKMEQHYADRMLVLVDDLKLASAEAIMQEMTYTGDKDNDCDLFLDDLTEWIGEDINFQFYDLEDE
tara:strand:+ start:621 stop:860 length:240 start_codon:yes stop_codon:yes gene_type:complete